MVELARAIAAVALEIKDKMDEHIRALGNADPNLGFALNLFGSGASGAQWKKIAKNTKNKTAAQTLSVMTADVASEAYLKGIIFGLKLAEEYGMQFVETPEGIALEAQDVAPAEHTHEGMVH